MTAALSSNVAGGAVDAPLTAEQTGVSVTNGRALRSFGRGSMLLADVSLNGRRRRNLDEVNQTSSWFVKI